MAATLLTMTSASYGGALIQQSIKPDKRKRPDRNSVRPSCLPAGQRHFYASNHQRLVARAPSSSQLAARFSPVITLSDVAYTKLLKNGIIVPPSSLAKTAMSRYISARRVSSSSDLA